MKNYLTASKEQGPEFYQAFNDKGKIVMLNLLRYRQIADYTNLEELKPANQISGKEAYALYMKNTLPLLHQANAKVLFYGDSNSFLIGPNAEKWDTVILVEHQSVVEFMKFAENKDYLKGAGHRTAALEDSRLLPITNHQIQESIQ